MTASAPPATRSATLAAAQEAVGPALAEPAALLRRLYRTLVSVRLLDRRAAALQRRGRLPDYHPVGGREAVQVGCAAALDPARDQAFPAARDLGVAVVTGADAALALRGPHRPALGSPVTHAVAWALGAKLDRTGGCALVLPSAAATRREAEEAMTTAALSHLPVVFVGRAGRPTGVALPVVLVDGRDALAMHDATAAALERARSGEGPTLIEPMLPEPQAWPDRDPLRLCEQRLRETGTVDDGFFAEVADTAAELAEGVLLRLPMAQD
jgi:pyruvate dehydrogenase E1 component alpha subunit